MVSSLVGDMTTQRMPTLVECSFNFAMVGIKNAAVFPDPVRAIALISFPDIHKGIAFR